MQVTYHEPGAAPMSDIMEHTFNVLDLLLVLQFGISDVLQMFSDRFGTIASHHFFRLLLCWMCMWPEIHVMVQFQTDSGQL